VANSQLSHNIAQQTWEEFGPLLRELRFEESDFSFGSIYAAGGPNISELPKAGLLGGPSGHNGWDIAHSTAWQATREYLDSVSQQYRGGPNSDSAIAAAREQILALRDGLAQAVKKGELALNAKDEKFEGWSDERLLQRNRDVVARIGAQQRVPVVPNTKLLPLAPKTGLPASSGRLLAAFKKLGAAGAVLGTTITASEAATQFRSGDTRGGTRTIVGFLGGFGGGLAASLAAGAITRTFAVGPIGAVVGGVVSFGAGIYGGIVGEQLATSAFDRLWPQTPTTPVVGDADIPPPIIYYGTITLTFNNTGQSSRGTIAYVDPYEPPPPVYPNDSGGPPQPPDYVPTPPQYVSPQRQDGGYAPPDDNLDEPVVLDLTGNGINIAQRTASNTFFDMTGGGQQNLTAWAGAGNGVLFFDPTGNGQLTQTNQIVFTDWDPSAASDMQALLDVFDTNHDGSLDGGDAAFANFFVMETNADGTQTAHSLASLGITSINLHADATSIALPDGSSIDGETTFTTASGVTGKAATVTFATDPNGYAVTTATTHNADGSVTIANTTRNSDGSVAYERMLNTLIATNTGTGVTTTTRTLANLNSGGVVTSLQTDEIDAGNGTTTETLVNYANGAVSASGELPATGTVGFEKLNSTTTKTTTSGGTTGVTIDRDQSGGGTKTQEEVDTTYADGSATDVVSDLNPNGVSFSNVEQTTVSADGLTRTISNLIDGIVAQSTTTTDATVVSGGTRTETITSSAGTTVTRFVQTATQTGVNKVTSTTTSDLTDGTTLDLTAFAETDTNADGSSTTTQTDTSANNTLLDRTVTTVAPQSGGGLVTTITTSELDGSGTFVAVDSKVTTISNAGATATTTVVDDSANGTLLSKSITTGTIGSTARTATVYGNGDGAITQSEVVAVNGATTTDTLENLNAVGTLVNATKTITAGLTTTTYVDSTSAGTKDAPVFDHITKDETTSSGGASTETVTDYGASTDNPIDRTQTVVSASGLDTTVSQAFTGASLADPAAATWDQVSDDQTTVNADGTLKETITVTDGAGHVLQTTQTYTSADRRTVTTTTSQGTTGLVKQVETVDTAGDGTVSDQIVELDRNRDVIEATVTTTSADGPRKTVQKDIQGQLAASTASGLVFDSTTSDTTVINPNGSRTETIEVKSGDGGNTSLLLSTSSTLTSANGLTVTTTANPYATPDFATQTVDATTLNADGSRTEDVRDYSHNGAFNGVPIDHTRTITSASGLSATVQNDFDGNGITDQASTDFTTINADGSRTEVVTDYTGDTNGTVRDVTTTQSGIIVAGAGLETRITRQSNGSVPSYEVETIVPSADGTVTDTTRTYATAGGSLLLATTVTTSANGLVKTTATAVNGDTSTDFSTSDTTVLSADGKRAETVARSNKEGLISETVTTTSANGLSKMTQVDANGAKDSTGAAIFNLTTTDDTVLNTADGSRTETVTQTSANGTTIGQTDTTTSADKQTVTTQRRLGETGNAATVDQVETVQTQADGSVSDTTKSYDAASALLGTLAKSTSGNGLTRMIEYDNAAGAPIDRETCIVTYDANGDGGQLEDCEDALVADATVLLSSVRTQTSGNGQSKSVTLALTGELTAGNTASFSAVANDDIEIKDDGRTIDTVTDKINGAATASDTTTTETSADRRTIATSTALGAASSYIVDTKTTNLDGSTHEVTTYFNQASPSVIERQTTVDTSFDGRTVSTTTMQDFDGTKYNVVHDTAVKNVDGTTSETRSGTGSFGAPASSQSVTTAINADASQTNTTLNCDAAGKLIGQTVADVSANGLTKSFVFDTTGQESLATMKTAGADLLAGAARPSTMLSTDIIETDTTTLDAVGSRTEVVETASGNSFANLRTLTTSTTRANGLSTVTQVDNDGNGIFEQVDTRTVMPNGATTDVVDYYGDTAATATTVTGSNTTTTSEDGLVTTLTTSSGITDTTATFANGNGSYQFSQTVAAGSAAATQGFAAGSTTHDIDANGIDTWSWQDGSAGQITIDVATESQDVAIANQIYMTLLGRGMDGAETQYLAHYISNGVLDRQALAKAIVTDGKGEYANDFYDVLNFDLNSTAHPSTMSVAVIAAFENSFGRLPTAQEAQMFGALAHASSGTASNIAAIAVAVAQYAADQGSTNHRTLIDRNQGDALSGPSWIDPASTPNRDQAAAVFGSTLGQSLGNGNTFAQLAQNTAVSVVSRTLASEIDSIAGASGDQGSIEQAADGALASISPSLASAFQAQSFGALSSFLTGELAQGLGFTGTSFGAQLLKATTGSLLNTVLSNAVKIATANADATTLFAGVSGSISVGVADFIGGFLAHEIAQPENQGGALGGSLGSTLGSTLLGSVGSQILTSLGFDAAVDTGADLILGTALSFAFPLVGAFIGQLIGMFLGDLFGSLFAGDDTFQGDVAISFSDGHALAGTAGGFGNDVKKAQNLADATASIINHFIDAIGGQAFLLEPLVLDYFLQNGNASGFATEAGIVVGGPKPVIYASWNGSATESGEMIDNMAIAALKRIGFSGGNIYMEQALANSQATTLEQLAGDLKVGEDYGRYLADKSVIDDLIALNPNSAFAAGWVVTLLQAEALGLAAASPQNGPAFLHGGAGATLTGGPFNDTLFAGPGEILVSGGGNDTYVFNRGDGANTIVDDAAGTLAFGPGISVADLEIKQYGSNLVVGVIDPANLTATFAALPDQITLQNWTTTADQVKAFQFADGTTLDTAAIASMVGTPAFSFSVQPASGNAGQAIALPIVARAPFTQESVSVRITGLRSDWVLSAGTKNADGSWTLTSDQLFGLTLTMPAGSFAGIANLTVAATASESDGSQTSPSANLPVAVGGVATAPTLAVQNASGTAGSPIPLSIASALTATDGTESLSITIGGLPPGPTLSAGRHNADGSWTLTQAQLANLSLSVTPGSFAGIANLTVTSSAIESDGSQASTSAAIAATIVDVPGFSGIPAAVAFTEKGSAVPLAGAAAVSDLSAQTLASVTVAIASGTVAGDVLAASTAGTSVTASYNAATETLVLSGVDTLAHYGQVLDSVTFASGSLNSTVYGADPTRTITWSANDGTTRGVPTMTTVNIAPINDPPTVSSVATSVAYTEQAAAVTLSGGLSALDPDNLTLANATVKIIGGTFAGDGDVLGFSVAGTAITGSYNVGAETLVLSGMDTVAHYQSVLDSVTFFDPSDNPTNFGANASRTVVWTVNDGSASNNTSAPQATTVNVTAVNDPPTLAGVPSVEGFRIRDTVTLASAASLSDPDSPTLASATVRITGGTFAGDGDQLLANVSGTSIAASYSAATETLTLTGSDTVAHYQQALESITLSSGSDPTNAGLNPTRTLSWTVNDGSASNNIAAATTTVSISALVRNDFNGDHNSDILLQNTDGTPMIWTMNGLAATSQTTLIDPGSGWRVVGSGDFNGDSKSDILLQFSDGTPSIWLMNGTTIMQAAGLTNPGSGWRAVGTGDFNGDGKSDILWQFADGTTSIWSMNGMAIAQAGIVLNAGSGWRAVGTGDFDNDGKSDIVLQFNDGGPATGMVSIWLMNGMSIAQAGLTPNPGAAWRLIGTGDFNGDGHSDLLFQNNDGTPMIWIMNGMSVTASVTLPNPGSGWRAVGTGDYNGDGRSDILFQFLDGTPSIWFMNGTTPIGSGVASNPGANWHASTPVLLGLNGNGIDIVPLGASTARFDMGGTGTPVATAWAGTGDGILAINLAPDGQPSADGNVIDRAQQIEFTQWAPGTTSDMAALAQVFDTNHNGALDAGDADWSDFRVWVNSNGVGTGQVFTLDQLGITSINLEPAGPAQQFSDGSAINGTTTYAMADGTTGVAGDVALAYASGAGPAGAPPGEAAPVASAADAGAPVLAGADPYSALMAAIGGPPASGAGSAPIMLSSGASVEAGLSQLVSALAANSSGDRGFDAQPAVLPPDDAQRQMIAAALHP